MTARRLGRRPADHSRPALMLGPSLTGAIPAHPANVDYWSKIPIWGMLGNDMFGDCGPADLFHDRMHATAYLTDTPYVATEPETLAFYQLCDPEFDPVTDRGDDGVVLQDMLAVAAAHGVAGVVPVCFAKVDHTNIDEIRAAIAIFGSVTFGVDLDVAQEQQTDSGGPWDYVRSSEWGGHCVLGVGYTSASNGSDIAVVTWGEVIGTTDAFLQHQLDEAWVVVWPEHLSSEAFLAGVDVATLAADFQALTGRTFPNQPQPEPPAPTPTPVPVPPVPGPADADTALGDALRTWIAANR